MIKTGTGLLDDALISYAEGGMNKVKNNFADSLEGNVLSLGMIGAGKLGKVTKTLGTVEKVDPIVYKEVASIGTKGVSKTTGRMNMANKTHPVSGVKFDSNGFPIFKSEYNMHLEEVDYLKSRSTNFSRASKSLYDEIQRNSELASKFTQNEINIFKEGGVPKRFTWHHNQEPGLMQLVDRRIHRQTGHDGGFSIWGPDNK